MKFFSFITIMISLLSCASHEGARGLASADRTELYQVGEVKISVLEIDEFQDKYGKVWVLMDGRDASGSEFSSLTAMTKVPDARGKFLRMNNNGASGENFDPDSDRTLGSFQEDMAGPHQHALRGRFTGVAPGHGHALGFKDTTNHNSSL
ncbi:MAG: hypothetical protein KC493_17725, partial [Bacteriovoracaceae bacterium]|nr:hypothetical protein [Bacteriovoracaceae bacterium]